MTAEDFIIEYEAALASQKWNEAKAFISKNATVTFSDGTRHVGIKNIQAAYEHNFTIIKSEVYKIQNVHWIEKTDKYAIYTFNFNWSGIINSKLTSGSGVGTTSIVKRENKWMLIAEHLGKNV